MSRLLKLGLVAAVGCLIGGADRSVAAEPTWHSALFPSGQEFRIELAVTEEKRAMGYMFREAIADDEGMLFVFEEPGHYGFWMRNCLVALDLVWLDDNFEVVHVVEQAEPCPPQGNCPMMRPMQSARYVLEIAGGGVARHGLQLGDPVVMLPRNAGP